MRPPQSPRTLIGLAALVAALWLVPAPAQAQGGLADRTITKVGTTSAQFLKLGVGARPVALGGTYVAQANDLSSLYWNPAGLARMQGSQVQLAFTDYLADIDYGFAAFGIDLGLAGTIGAAVLFLDSGDMDVRTVDRPEGTGEQFKVQSFALQLSYGRALTDRFSVGGSAKFVNESIWHSRASTVALDVGVLFTTPFDRLRLGASIANFGSNMHLTGRDLLFSDDPFPSQSGNVEIVNSALYVDDHPLPLLFRVGLAFDAVETADHRVLFLTDAAHPNDNSEYLNMGLEYSFRDLLALRTGYRNLFETDGEQGVTFGGGLNLRLDRGLRAQFDYAYADFGRLEQTHWFTLGLAF